MRIPKRLAVSCKLIDHDANVRIDVADLCDRAAHSQNALRIIGAAKVVVRVDACSYRHC